MPKNVKELMAALPASRRKKIEALANKLIAEELTFRELRLARKLIQEG